MQYLGTEYKLAPVEEALYKRKAARFSSLQIRLNLQRSLELMTEAEDVNLADMILTYSGHIQESYGEGGGYYAMSMGIGIAALRAANPTSVIPSIEPEDWDGMIAREAELRTHPGLTTIEAQSGIGLLQIGEVNPGYVDGYQEAMNKPGLTPYLGFTGLGAMNAHDLMHTASLRS